MPRLAIVLSVIMSAAGLVAQTPSAVPASDPQAVMLAQKSVAALSGGSAFNDVTLDGTATWFNPNGENGSVTLRASGTGESRLDLMLTSGTRSEIRDASTGSPQGEWITETGKNGLFAGQNCWTDAVWFYPALGSLTMGPNVVLSYVGQESRAGSIVQHLRSYTFQPFQPPGSGPTPQQLSTMDFYLDATTFLPSAITFNAHPDNNASANWLIEIDFSNYQNFSGAMVPTRIQKYSQGNLLLDLTISGASFNTGLPLSDFAVN